MWKNSLPVNGTLHFEDNKNYEVIEIENYQEGKAVIYFKNNQKYSGNLSLT